MVTAVQSIERRRRDLIRRYVCRCSHICDVREILSDWFDLNLELQAKRAARIECRLERGAAFGR